MSSSRKKEKKLRKIAWKSERARESAHVSFRSRHWVSDSFFFSPEWYFTHLEPEADEQKDGGRTDRLSLSLSNSLSHTLGGTHTARFISRPRNVTCWIKPPTPVSMYIKIFNIYSSALWTSQSFKVRPRVLTQNRPAQNTRESKCDKYKVVNSSKV